MNANELVCGHCDKRVVYKKDMDLRKKAFRAMLKKVVSTLKEEGRLEEAKDGVLYATPKLLEDIEYGNV